MTTHPLPAGNPLRSRGRLVPALYRLLKEDDETAEYLAVIEALGVEITDEPPAVPSGSD